MEYLESTWNENPLETDMFKKKKRNWYVLLNALLLCSYQTMCFSRFNVFLQGKLAVTHLNTFVLF